MKPENQEIRKCPGECVHLDEEAGECYLLLNSSDIDNVRDFFEGCPCDPMRYMAAVTNKYLAKFSFQGGIEVDDIVHEKMAALLDGNNSIDRWFEKKQKEIGPIRRDRNTLWAFLHAVMRNATIDTVRKPIYRNPHKTLEPATLETSRGMDPLGKNLLNDFLLNGLKDEKMADILNILKRVQRELGPKYTHVFVSHYIEDIKVQDLAAHYNVSNRTISRWMGGPRKLFELYWKGEK